MAIEYTQQYGTENKFTDTVNSGGNIINMGGNPANFNGLNYFSGGQTITLLSNDTLTNATTQYADKAFSSIAPDIINFSKAGHDTFAFDGTNTVYYSPYNETVNNFAAAAGNELDYTVYNSSATTLTTDSSGVHLKTVEPFYSPLSHTTSYYTQQMTLAGVKASDVIVEKTGGHYTIMDVLGKNAASGSEHDTLLGNTTYYEKLGAGQDNFVTQNNGNVLNISGSGDTVALGGGTTVNFASGSSTVNHVYGNTQANTFNVDAQASVLSYFDADDSAVTKIFGNSTIDILSLTKTAYNVAEHFVGAAATGHWEIDITHKGSSVHQEIDVAGVTSPHLILDAMGHMAS